MIGRLDQDSQTTIFTDTDLVEHLNVLGMALKYHPNFVTHLLNFAKQKFDPTILSVILETCSSFDRNALMTAILHAPRCLDDLEDDGLLAALHTLNPIDCLATLSKPDQSGHSPLILAIINRNRCLLDLIHVIESLHPIDQQALIEGLVRTAAERPSFSCHNLLIVAKETARSLFYTAFLDRVF
jgi:hypothetical protein